MGLIIDADTHVAESEQMWALLEKSVYPRRPIMMRVPDDTLYGSSNAFWLIDGNIVPKPAGKGGNRLITPSNVQTAVIEEGYTSRIQRTD